MTATVHGLVGASIATMIPNPVIAFPIIFLSHFLLDKIPHWDPLTNKANKTFPRILSEIGVDYITSYLLVILFFGVFFQSQNLPYLLLAAFISQLPDTLEGPYILTKKHFPVFYQLYQVQHWFHDVWFNARLKAPWGIVTQVVVATIFLYFARST